MLLSSQPLLPTLLLLLTSTLTTANLSPINKEIYKVDGKLEVEYMALRDKTMSLMDEEAFDSSTTLNSKEERLNSWLLEERDAYIIENRNSHTFAPSTFYHNWDHQTIHESVLFKFVEDLPKGAALHLHSGSSGSTDWIVDNGIDMEGCHVYMGEEDKSRCLSPHGEEIECSPGASYFAKGMIAFYDVNNENVTIPSGFLPTSEQLDTFGSTNFRSALRSLITSNSDLEKLDSSLAWDYFDKIFLRTGIAMNYQPFFSAYLANTFQVHVDDNVQHIEIRALIGSNGLGDQYDFAGNIYSGDQVVDIYRRALSEFQKTYSHFTMKLIVSSLRVFDPSTVSDDVKEAVRLKSKNEDIICGFDLVAEEDPNHRTLDYLSIWLTLKSYEKASGVDIPLYFHDGESNDKNDTNIVDAVLLDSKRIGHGTNLYFFPSLVEEIKSRGITLEVNPLSNQILRYVDNLELHPANTFLADGINVVISSDDPGCFGYAGLSNDWWISLISFQLDLKGLKTLALNSLTFSGVIDGSDEKKKMIENWENEWEKFVDRSLEKIEGGQ